MTDNNGLLKSRLKAPRRLSPERLKANAMYGVLGSCRQEELLEARGTYIGKKCLGTNQTFIKVLVVYTRSVYIYIPVQCCEEDISVWDLSYSWLFMRSTTGSPQKGSIAWI